MWPQCWLCAVCAVGHVSCCVWGGGILWGLAYHHHRRCVTKSRSRLCVRRFSATELGVYKIFFHFEAFVHESIILVLPPPICISHTIAIPLHGYCAECDTPSDPLLYSIHHTMLTIAISCKGEHGTFRGSSGSPPRNLARFRLRRLDNRASLAARVTTSRGSGTDAS